MVQDKSHRLCEWIEIRKRCSPNDSLHIVGTKIVQKCNTHPHPHAPYPHVPHCYILVECSAQHELDGYDFDTLHVVLEACASDTL